jgi:hypothetical protein
MPLSVPTLFSCHLIWIHLCFPLWRVCYKERRKTKRKVWKVQLWQLWGKGDWSPIKREQNVWASSKFIPFSILTNVFQRTGSWWYFKPVEHTIKPHNRWAYSKPNADLFKCYRTGCKLNIVYNFSTNNWNAAASINALLTFIASKSQICFCFLKVLSSEMGPAVIKEWGAEIFRIIRPSPMLWEPFKVRAPFRTTVGDLEEYCQRRTQLCQRPFIHYIQLLATSFWTNLESVSSGAINIFIWFFEITHSSENAHQNLKTLLRSSLFCA